MSVQEYTLHTNQQGEHTFKGTQLGHASSGSEVHTHGSPQPDQRFKCHACRWSETTIYRTSDNRYVGHTVGKSTMAGEIDFARIVFARNALELVELLTVRKGTPFLPLPSARALAQAAEDDDAVFEAYSNRAVI